MEIIDSHCHIFPDKIAEKAVKSIGNFYGLKMSYKGTCKNLIEVLDKNNIDKAVIHSTATKADQVPSINDFIIDTVNSSERFIGYGTMHPDYKDIEAEYNKIKSNNLKGVKIHPDFQGINIDDKRMDDIYELVGDEMPILFHIGDKTKDFSNPIRLKKTIERFPKLRPIAAHMGGYSKWNEAMELFYGKEVWVDTCSSFTYMTDAMILKLINSYGIDKILFGTDYPMWDFNYEYQRLISLKLKDEELEKIFSKNIKSLLKI